MKSNLVSKPVLVDLLYMCMLIFVFVFVHLIVVVFYFKALKNLGVVLKHIGAGYSNSKCIS